jgi:Holliday junction resolvase
MSASQRNKGSKSEREFCKALSEHLGETFTRELGSARDGGPDLLVGTQWAVEIKRCEELRLKEWWAQACEQAVGLYRYPALAYRQSRQAWCILVPLDVVLWGIKTWESPNTLDWTAQVSVAGFATVIRESLRT